MSARFPRSASSATCKDPVTGEMFSRDPRYVAQKAEAYLTKSGIASDELLGARNRVLRVR